MIILQGHPLSMVEHGGFRLFVKNLQPLFELVTFNRVEADCIEIYQKEKQKLYEVVDKLRGKISLSDDTWVAKEDAYYLSLTAHFIDDDWQLKRKVLNFLMVDPSHTEDMISEMIMTSLMDWDIDRKLFSMTIDTNIIKFMVQDALEALSEITHKIRKSIRLFKTVMQYAPLWILMVEGMACHVGGSGDESRDRLTGFDRFLHESSQSQNTKSDLDKYFEDPLFPLNMDFQHFKLVESSDAKISDPIYAGKQHFKYSHVQSIIRVGIQQRK
ncbi:hypothetical protein Acr_00g0096060 [Actinidia rufa]|uniref:Uncharacterized protein n=1 Tax=Actinidia rufa TaxID=165716 RepID=A0A7J0DYM7_9ERIC|nr:hypothetical protein Acr_00g0096060 [Actinidia rufa]